jgi:hypothetical protein
VTTATAAADRAAQFLARRRHRDIVAALVAVAITAFWFFRLIEHIDNAVLYQPNDESYSIRLYWAAAHFHSTPWTLHRDILNGWPEGLGIPTAVEWANLMIPGVIWGLHYAVGITTAENIFLLGGFALSAFSIYVLLDRFGFHPVASGYAAYAITFSPWMFERAGAGHHGFMQLWVFVLLIASLLYVRKRHTPLSAALAGAALTLAMYDSPYYGLLGCVLFGVFAVIDFIEQPSWSDRLWSFALLDIAIVTAIIAYLPALIAWHYDRAAVAAGVSNPIQEVQNGGANIASYAMPGTRNPFLGDITRHFYPRADFNWSENTLYIGWSLVALAIVGIVLVLRRNALTTRTSLLRYFLVCTAVLLPVAFVWSLKAKSSILGVDVPMPSYFAGHITTFWRAYARFGVLVLFACGILAALSIHWLLRLRRTWATGLVVLAFAGIAVEHAISIPTIYKLTPPPAWAQWLKQQPFGSVANYPLPTDKPAALTLLAESYFNQTYDKQPQFMLFGTGYGDTREDAIRILARHVLDPLVPGILKAEQVKYVLLHDDVYRAQGEEPPGIPSGMYLVTNLPGHVRVLKIKQDVPPANLDVELSRNATEIALVQGLPIPELRMDPARAADGSQTLNDEGQAELNWSGPNLAVVQFYIHASSPDRPRTLQLLDGSGNVLAGATVDTTDTNLILGPARVNGDTGNAHFTLRVEPSGGVRINSIQVQPVANVGTSILDNAKG